MSSGIENLIFQKKTILIKVKQKRNDETGRLDKKLFFNGNVIETWSFEEEDVFTGPLQVWVADKWNPSGIRFSVLNFLYENL